MFCRTASGGKKHPLDSLLLNEEAAVSLCQHFIMVLFLPHLNTPVFLLQFHSDGLELQVFAFPFAFSITAQVSLFPSFQLVFGWTSSHLSSLSSTASVGTGPRGPARLDPTQQSEERGGIKVILYKNSIFKLGKHTLILFIYYFSVIFYFILK